MGYTSTFKFVNLGIRRRVFRRLKKPHHQWDMMKNMLDSLIKNERIETTLPKAKELQQYAEEIIVLAKKDTTISDLKVESMLRTSAARRKLFEVLVPRYEFRNFFFTRIINQWRFRMRDASSMAYIEYVDSPIELRPSKPVGFDRIKYIHTQMMQNRRNFRLFKEEAIKLNLLDENNRLLPSIEHLQPVSKYKFTADPIAPSNDDNSNLRMLPGPFRGLEPFHVDIPPPHKRNKTDRFLRKKQKK